MRGPDDFMNSLEEIIEETDVSDLKEVVKELYNEILKSNAISGFLKVQLILKYYVTKLIE